MHAFLENLKSEKKDLADNIEQEYNILFKINFADLIFADKVIMFEGDTERMYLRSLLQKEIYTKLQQQYIAFFTSLTGLSPTWIIESVSGYALFTTSYNDPSALLFSYSQET